jgi:hypothetical protein
MSELELYLAVLDTCDDSDVDAVHSAFWCYPTDMGALYMFAMVYGVGAVTT